MTQELGKRGRFAKVSTDFQLIDARLQNKISISCDFGRLCKGLAQLERSGATLPK